MTNLPCSRSLSPPLSGEYGGASYCFWFWFFAANHRNSFTSIFESPTMQAYYLFLQGFLTCLVLASANYAVGSLASTTVASQLLEKCRNNIYFTDLFLGNSLIAAGIDENSFNEERNNDCKAFNAGCGSTKPLEHALILHQATRPMNGILFYGFFDTQLTDKSLINWQSLVGNRTITLKTDLNLALKLSDHTNFINVVQLQILSKIPLFYERLAIWAKVEKARRKVGDIGRNSTETARFGRKEDFQLLEPKNSLAFENELKKLLFNKVKLSKPILDIISQSKIHQNKAVFLVMPMTSAHRTKFNNSDSWNSYLDQITEVLAKQDVRLINCLDWIDDSLFEDHLHLSAQGAKVFSTRLAKYLSPSK